MSQHVFNPYALARCRIMRKLRRGHKLKSGEGLAIRGGKSEYYVRKAGTVSLTSFKRNKPLDF